MHQDKFTRLHLGIQHQCSISCKVWHTKSCTLSQGEFLIQRKNKVGIGDKELCIRSGMTTSNKNSLTDVKLKIITDVITNFLDESGRITSKNVWEVRKPEVKSSKIDRFLSNSLNTFKYEFPKSEA